MLEELARATEHHALELLGLAKGEEPLPRSLGALRGLQVGLHQVEVAEDKLVRRDSVVELCEDIAGLVVMAFGDEPPGGLGQHESTGRRDQSKDDLEGHGEPPLDRSFDVGETKVDPVGNERADGNDGTLEADEETSVMGARAFRLPDGDRGRVHAISKAGNDTAHDELAQTPLRTESSDRDNGADGHDDAASDHQTSAADPVAKQEGEDCAEETADLVAGRDGAAEDGDVLGVRAARALGDVENGELFGELGTRDDTGHQALVVAEEGEAHDGGEGDGPVQFFALQAGG